MLKAQLGNPPLLLFLGCLIISLWAPTSEGLFVDRCDPGEARFRFSKSLRCRKYHDCWTRLRGMPGCQDSLLYSSEHGDMKMDQKCCSTVLRLPESCSQKLFSNDLFKPGFGDRAKDYCVSLLQRNHLHRDHLHSPLLSAPVAK